MTRLRRVATTLSSAAATALVMAPTVAAQVEWTGGCVVETQFGDQTAQVATIQGIECLVANVLATATTFIGLAAFVMLLLGGFLYLTSGSSGKGVEAAKQTITYAIIGIVVALMAFFILTLISTITGVTSFLNFDLNITQ